LWRNMAYIDGIHHGFVKCEENGVVFFKIEAIEKLGLYNHGFSSRIGGVSTGSCASLNLSRTRGDQSLVDINYGLFADAVKIDKSIMTACHYEHGNKVITAGAREAGAGVNRENDLPFCDGVVVKDKSAAALTLHADCTPLFFADKKGRAAGVAHAGWKGTLGAISESMIDELGVPAEDIICAVGPSIRACCFEVQSDVSSLFTAKYGEGVLSVREGRQYIDLLAVTLMQLEGKGIPPENVTVSDMCTYCERELFYSHRRDKGDTGAMASVIAFK